MAKKILTVAIGESKKESRRAFFKGIGMALAVASLPAAAIAAAVPSEPQHRAKLSQYKIDLIREMLEGGMSFEEIAARFA